jgi:hypothetical protein
MRHAPAGGLLLLFVLAAPGDAQTAGEFYVVKQPGTEVRALTDDSDKNYVTNRLRKGDVVEVVERVPGGEWLRIRPPSGSTSWINSRFLDEVSPDRPNKVVALEDSLVPVFPAPADHGGKRPGVVGVRLKRGFIVTRAGGTQRDAEGTWMEIRSPDEEARYVRADAVERGSADIQRTAATDGGLPRSRVPSANVETESPAELARRAAVAADNSRNYAEAVRLYDGIVAQFGATHPQFAKAARARADYLRNEHNVPGPLPDVFEQPARGSQNPSTAPVSTGGARPVSPRDGSATGREQDDRTGASSWARITQARTDPRDVRNYRGYLTSAHSQPIDGRRPYLLQLTPAVPGMTWFYAVAGPGVNLEPLAGRDVSLRGPITYEAERRAFVMQVMQATAQ